MKPKHAYLGLSIVGTILPYSQFIPFLREHGLNIQVFFQQLFSTRVGGFFGMDVIVSSLVLWVLVYTEGQRAGRSSARTIGLRRFVCGVGNAVGWFGLQGERYFARDRMSGFPGLGYTPSIDRGEPSGPTLGYTWRRSAPLGEP